MTADRGQGPPGSLNRPASRRPGNSPSDATKVGKPADAVLNTAAWRRWVAPPPLTLPFRAARGQWTARGPPPTPPVRPCLSA